MSSSLILLRAKPAALNQFSRLIIFCCLLVLSGHLPAVKAEVPNGPKKLATNLRGFGVPFRINADDESYIEVQLYISEDQGKSWKFHDRQTTEKSEFPFQADRDGEYWFALKTLNRNRQLLPEGKTQPELIILVDTVQPELTFQIESDPAGRVACRWKASDNHLDTSTFQIFYQPAEAPADSWTRVPVQLQGTSRNGLYTDQIAWWPETTARSLNVRMMIADTAGNLVQQDRRIMVPETPWRHRSKSTARTGDAISSGQQPVPYSYEAIQKPESFPPANALPSNHMAAEHPVFSDQKSSRSNQPVCENGVCRLPKKKPTVTSPQPLANSQRFANSGSDFRNRHGLALIGSPPEYAAPPVPTGYVAPTGILAKKPPTPHIEQPVTQPAGNRPAGNSIPWTSEPERWTTKSQSSSSTTLGPDPRVLPNPFLEKSSPATHLPAPNPNTTKLSGDQVIAESSTTFPRNQYRGLSFQPNPYSVAGSAANASPDQDHKPQAPSNVVVENPPPTWLPNQYDNTAAIAQMARAEQENWNTNNGHEPQYHASSRADASANTANSFLAKSVVDASTPNEISDSSIQMIGSKRFRLNYGIDAIDPSGVAKVDLWMTRDGGRKWTAWGSDPDNASPFPVEVEEEGRYGFRIVVHSKDGLTGRGPSSGDSADIWVQVDTKSPLAQIVSVPYGRGEEAGRLIINYRVADPHLVLRPISLAYSRNPAGPWTSIAEGLRNEGRYAWKPTSNVPDRIFLRLDARDRAGNLGVHQLSQAIDVSGLVPRGTIHGVVPVVAQ